MLLQPNRNLNGAGPAKRVVGHRRRRTGTGMGITDTRNQAAAWEYLAFDPIYGTIVKAFPQGAGSLRLAANHRYADATKAVDDELTPYFKNEAGLGDATSEAAVAGNAVLAQA